MLETALYYQSLGWHILPLEPPIEGVKNSGKIPLGKLVPDGKDNATNDINIIKHWWTKEPNANIGVSAEPSGLVILDVDVGEGKQGLESLQEFASDLPDTLMATTGGGGIHYIYSRPPGTSILHGKIRHSLDLVTNGYFVAPGSLHYTGKRYTLANTNPVAPVPPCLINVQKQSSAATKRAADGEFQAKIDSGRNDALYAIGIHAYNAGMSLETLLAAMMAENDTRCDPPLPDDEVRQIYRSILNNGRNRGDVMLTAALFQDENKASKSPVVGIRLFDLVPRMLAYADQPCVDMCFKKLSAKVKGLPLHSLTVIVAGPGKGKTSLACTLGVAHAINIGPTIYYAAEMNPELIAGRMLGQITKTSWHDTLYHKGGGQHFYDATKTLPVYCVPRCADPIEAIKRTLALAKEDGYQGTPMVIIDYIQLLADVSKDMRMSTMQAVRDLQVFVEETNIVCIALSQSSRNGARSIRGGAGNAEELQDTGAETAELERAATNVLVISYETIDDAKVHDVTIFVAKARFGGGAKLGFKYNGETGQWSEAEAIPVSRTIADKRKQILHQILTHHGDKCIDGHRCAGSINTTAMTTKKNMHYVSGNTELITKTINDMAAEGLIFSDGGEWYATKTIVVEDK